MGKTFQQSESESPSFAGVGEAITATYYIETPFAPEQAAAVLAGEQSSGTFVAVPGETEELKQRFVRLPRSGYEHFLLLFQRWHL